MKRKLLVMDLGLVALAAVSGWHLREQWRAAQAREQAVLKQAIKPAPPPPYSRLPATPKVTAAAYIDIAQKMLFAKDRNPAVVVETAPAPPKPMPPLPVFHGVMNLGDGPIAILSEKPGGQHRDFRPGEKVSEFKLLAVNSQEIVLEWDGKVLKKNVEDLIERGPPQPPPGNVDSRPPAAAAAAQPSAPPVAKGPGVDIGKGVRACQPGDASAPGTVADGLRKVVSESPFGPVCRWEPVK